MKKTSTDLSMFDKESKDDKYSRDGIIHYFERLCIPPFLETPQEEEIQHVLQITQGRILPVMILAHRYHRSRERQVLTNKNHDLQQVTENIQQLITQILSDTSGQRSKLYGLALLRTINDPKKISNALGIGQRSKHVYDRSFHQLYQDHSFVFTNKTHQYFQEDIRDFLRHWLFAHRKETEVNKIIMRIYENQERAFHEIEEQHAFQRLQDRLNNERWVETFLDLIEAQFWVDPAKGACSGIALLLIANLYYSSLVQQVVNIGSFFADKIADPQFNWWRDVCQGLNVLGSSLQIYKRINALERLEVLITRQKLPLPLPLVTYSKQLIAALWWQKGELYRDFSIQDALIHYTNALPYFIPQEYVSEYTARLYWKLVDTIYDSQLRIEFLTKVTVFQPDFADAYYNLGNAYFNQKQYRLARTCYQYAIELKPHLVEAWINLAHTHARLKEYQRALDELTYAQHLDSQNALLYYNRANVYRELGMYTEALKDFDSVIELDKTCTYAGYAYLNRGNVYAILQMRKEACQDYAHAAQLLPDDINPLWLQEWIHFGKQRVGHETAQRLQKIATLNPSDHLAAVCMVVARGLIEKDLKSLLPELECACDQDPDQWDAYFWLAMLAAYLNRSQQAESALNRAIELGLPALFMLPLYWLEKDRPEFFKSYAEPMLRGHHL